MKFKRNDRYSNSDGREYNLETVIRHRLDDFISDDSIGGLNDRINNTQKAFVELIEILHSKHVLNDEDVLKFVSEYDYKPIEGS